MKTMGALFCALLLAAGPAAAQGKSKKEAKGGKMTLTVTSPAFKPNAYIPARYTCFGTGVSPELKWSGVPPGTQSLAVIMDDPDAPSGTWVHWVLFDIPPAAAGLREGVARKDVLPDGSRHGSCWGVNEDDFSRVGYYGPCPPAGKPHRYFFKVYALDTALDLPAGSSKGAVLKAMQGHVLAQGELVGLFKR